MKFEVTILGSSSATPIYNRNPTSQALNINEHLYLVDCGEGTQQQLMRFEIKSSRIDCIFISHLHGDHYLGLVGLLSSLHLNGRKKPLQLFGPAPLIEIIEMQLRYSETTLQYPLIFKATNPAVSELIYENPDIKVETIPLQHRIPCTGYIFRGKKRLRKLVRDRVEELDIPVSYYSALKNGADYTAPDGIVYSNDKLTRPPAEPKTYAYCSDTIYGEQYFEQIKGATYLYHEATFLHDMLDRAKDTFHTTALQAAQVAKLTGAEHLIIGHFSARYKNLNVLLEEAQSLFPATELAIEGKTFVIDE